MEDIMLKAVNVNAGYGKKEVLRNISFEIKKGELAGIIGPNGSGKTTLLKIITRLLKPWEGRLLLTGKDIAGMDFREIARITAVVSQSAETGWMSVEEYIMLGRMPYFGKFQFFENNNDRDIVCRYMKLTGINALKDKSMAEISGGERQLAFITRALAQEPRLLLLDEPTSYLDITHQISIMDLIRRLNKDLGITVIMILHDLNLASEYCGKLILLNDGEIYKAGSPQEVLTYSAIEEVYKTIVVVEKNPLSKKPFILLVSEEERGKV
ncbi:MAG: ABC transporter ATP-binding protein [Spirochaetota bacterium]